MSKKTWIIGGAVVVALIGATVIGRSLTGDKKAKSDSGKVTTLKVAHTQNYVPYDFVDKDGNSDGYEVAVLKEIDKKLPQYKFEYTGTSDDDLLIGLESGKYDIGTKARGTQIERAKKVYYSERSKLEQVLLDLPFVRMIKINIKISLTLQNKMVDWCQSHHKMLSGMLSKTTTMSIKINQLS